MSLKIIFEDEDLIVLDKNAGITVNRSDTTGDEQTVQDLVAHKIKFDPSDETDFLKRGGIVHRLDKETSGVLLVAKNKTAFENIQKQFKDRSVKKEYIALAHGQVLPKVGEINVPVGRLPWNRKRFGVLAGGRESRTLYEVIEEVALEKEILTLIKLNPMTGRTHQIRVHLKYMNRPIFGDFLYAGRKVSRNDRKILPRVFLHAAKISLVHPISGESLNFESPLPIELKNTLNVLEFNYGR